MSMCPACGTILRKRSQHAIVVEKCPSCNGAWFPRKELDKLWARVRQLQLDLETRGKQPAVRPGLYDLDHCYTGGSSTTEIQRRQQWTAILELLE